MRPLVSVVCACFNISKYLDEAIASIYAQGYPNLELIVVDDGSTDDTYERLAMLRELHGFQLYRQANRGVSDALNHGLRHARGEFVMTPDLDDIPAWSARHARRLLACAPRGRVRGRFQYLYRQCR